MIAVVELKKINEPSVYYRNSSLSHLLPSTFGFKTFSRSSKLYPALVYPAGPSLLEQHRRWAERSQVSRYSRIVILPHITRGIPLPTICIIFKSGLSGNAWLAERVCSRVRMPARELLIMAESNIKSILYSAINAPSAGWSEFGLC